MRRRFVVVAPAALVALGACLGFACSLTTDLDGLAGGAAADLADTGVSDAVPQGSAIDGAQQPDGGDAGADAADYRSTVMADGPVLYYRFEDSQGSNVAKDDIGGRDAILTGPATFGGIGASGQAIALNGSTSLEVADVLDFAGKVPFTLEAWVKSSATGQDQILFRKREEQAGMLKGYILYLKSDRTAQFEGWGVELSAWTEMVLPPSRFTHLVVSVGYEGGKGNSFMYVDGQRSANGGYDNTTDLVDTLTKLTLGIGFIGTLDEVAIYDKALTPQRILAHFRAGKP
jgi:hypothetical protein